MENEVITEIAYHIEGDESALLIDTGTRTFDLLALVHH